MAKENNQADASAEHVSHTDDMNDFDHVLHGKEKWWNWRVMMNLVIVGLSLGLFGYDNAFAAPLVSLPLFVEKYQGPSSDGTLVFTVCTSVHDMYNIANFEHARNLDLTITVPLVGAALGAFGATLLQKRLGRKMSFLLAYGTCSIPGSILQLFAPNIGALVVGRFWNYFGVSILTNTAPLYLSELVPVRHRARAVGLTVAGGGAVSVIATVVVWGSEKINDSRQYTVPLIIQAVLPVLLFALSLLLTESPIWLLSKGRIEEAKSNLSYIRGGNTRLVEAEISSAVLGLRSHSESEMQVGLMEILKPPHLERTLSSGALLCLSQVGGQILVGTYSTVILVQSGVADPFKITIIIFLLQFLGTLVGPFLVDRVGRRPVALVGFVLLLFIDIIAGALACAGLKTSPQRLGLASLCMIFGFINSLSFQSLAYVIPTEIPTARLREPTMAWAVFWSYTTAIITTFAIPQITSADAGNLGAKAFLVFGGCMIVAILWAYFYLPETTNRTLAEIDELFEANIPKRRWREYKTTTTSNAAIVIMESKFNTDT